MMKKYLMHNKFHFVATSIPNAISFYDITTIINALNPIAIRIFFNIERAILNNSLAWKESHKEYWCCSFECRFLHNCLIILMGIQRKKSLHK